MLNIDTLKTAITQPRTILLLGIVLSMLLGLAVYMVAKHLQHSRGVSIVKAEVKTEDEANTNAPRLLNLTMLYRGEMLPLGHFPYQVNDGEELYTSSQGGFIFKPNDTVSFTFSSLKLAIKASKLENFYSNISLAQLIERADNAEAFNADVLHHIKLAIHNLEEDANPYDGYTHHKALQQLDYRLPEKRFRVALFKSRGQSLKLLHVPSLGINLESPQAEADTAGQAMPFVDIFRTARPFAEFIQGERLRTDKHGWPIEMPRSNSIRTKLLQGTAIGALPSGDYVLFYEGEGELGISGVNVKVGNLPKAYLKRGLKGRTISYQPQQTENSEENVISVTIKGINSKQYIKNIRIIMPGGTCRKGDGSYVDDLHVMAQDDCASGYRYISFAERYADSRNPIIFNPDYLRFLRQFSTIRTMNLLDASPGRVTCYDAETDEMDDACISTPRSWDERAKLEDAVWGGSSRTPVHMRRGVPIEVVAQLVNSIKRNVWFNVPHNADDGYVSGLAKYMVDHLDDDIRIFIEYTNETWNSGFLGFYYVKQKGFEQGLNTVPEAYKKSGRDEEYFARVNYYAKRSLEIFKIWQREFGDQRNRLINVMGTSQGDTVLSDLVLSYENGANDGLVHGLAMAPYFFGCVTRAGICEQADKVLLEARTVDDVISIIKQPRSVDPSALDSTKQKIRRQILVADKYGVDLMAYEGGQHLTIMGALGEMVPEEKTRMRDLFKATNRDPRMQDFYQELLSSWRSTGGKLFNLYTLPQVYYEYGNWGIKEHLNASRQDSPKFDGSMDFQESIEGCAWSGC